MGHTRLGALSCTKPWREVVELIAVGADVAQIAEATIKAAEKAFSFVGDDCGYNHAVWLLTQLGLAGKSANPLEHMRQQGVNISDNTSLPGIVAALSEAIESASYQRGEALRFGRLGSPCSRRRGDYPHGTASTATVPVQHAGGRHAASAEFLQQGEGVWTSAHVSFIHVLQTSVWAVS